MKKKILIAVLTVGIIMSLFSCSNTDAGDNHETVVYKNGNIYTSDENQTYVSAIVVQDGKFVYVGDDQGAEKYEEGLPAENIIDLECNLVTPGLIEGHNHFGFMCMMRSMNYEEIPANISQEESLEILKKFVDDHPDYDQYVLGNFGQTLDIDAKMLDEICADKPVACIGAGLHNAYVNSKFLEAGNITKDTPDAIPGKSYYVRDEDGNPTGKMIELIQTWTAFQSAIKPDNDKLKEAIIQMTEDYHSMGFVGVADGGFLGMDDGNMLDILSQLEKQDNLNLIYCPSTIWYGHTVSDLSEAENRAIEQKEKFTSELIKPGTVKMWADGTTGSLSAALKEPYDVEGPAQYGLELATVEDLIACAQMCKENDLNIHYHAIGDQAIDNVLTAFETVGETTGQKSLVHFTISTPEMIEKASGIDDLIVNCTPTWASSLSFEEVDPVGERRDTYILYKEIMDAGVTVNFGSDSNGTIECWNPAVIILCAMTRDPDEEGLQLKGKPCTFEEAIDAYTINVAKERRIDDEHGSIEVGKSADFDIWNVNEFENVDTDNVTSSDEVAENAPYLKEVFLMGKSVYSKK